MGPSSQYLRTKGVREKLGGISPVTLWRLRQRPDFPSAVMVGRTPMWPEEAINQFMGAQPRERS